MGGAKETELFEKFMCYCNNGDAALAKSIADAEAKIPQVTADIEAGENEVKQLKADLTLIRPIEQRRKLPWPKPPTSAAMRPKPSRTCQPRQMPTSQPPRRQPLPSRKVWQAAFCRPPRDRSCGSWCSTRPISTTLT